MTFIPAIDSPLFSLPYIATFLSRKPVRSRSNGDCSGKHRRSIPSFGKSLFEKLKFEEYSSAREFKRKHSNTRIHGHVRIQFPTMSKFLSTNDLNVVQSVKFRLTARNNLKAISMEQSRTKEEEEGINALLFSFWRFLLINRARYRRIGRCASLDKDVAFIRTAYIFIRTSLCPPFADSRFQIVFSYVYRREALVSDREP